MNKRQVYIDNLKVALTVLVLLHHTAIMYSGTGMFYYMEGREDQLTVAVIGTFCAVNQAYFMSLFFMISAFFTPASLDKKGTAGFIRDRLIRLGIPLVAYDLFFHPLIMTFCKAFLTGSDETFINVYWHYFSHPTGVGRGPLWFVETLLIFSLVYAAARSLKKGADPINTRPFPGLMKISVFALAMGLVGFFVRIELPIGYDFGPLNLQIPFFPHYIAFYIAGVAAFRNGWFDEISGTAGKAALSVSACAIAILPVFMFQGGALSGKLDLFLGGWHAESLGFSIWQSILCAAMCIGLVWIFRERFNRRGKILEAMAGSAYFAYIIHPLVLVTVAFFIKGWHIHPILKFVCNGAISVVACFSICHLALRYIPALRKVL